MGVSWAWLLLAGLVAHAQGEHFLNQFAIRLKVGTIKTAEAVARQHGFRLKRELPHARVFLLEQPEDSQNTRTRRDAQTALQRLRDDARISHAQQEVALNRVKRRIIYDKQLELPIRDVDESLFKRVDVANIEQRDELFERSENYNDPKYKDMWYLENRGQSGGEPGLDMNMRKVWASGYTGRGVVVTVLDDGVDHTHPDLRRNFDARASTDLNDKRDHSGRGSQGDPMPDTSNIDNSHGTRCAGEIAAAANNNNCGVGVAYDCAIGGVRILDGVVTDALEAEALLFNNQYIHIYSASWGPSDDGATMEGPRGMGLSAIKQGAREGRGGKGSIFVWATGNGGMNDDDCSADGYVSQPETLSVGSVNDEGKAPFFMENCTSTLAVVPSGGEEYIGQGGQPHIKVVTTDFKGGCIENFQGTSSAAPLAAGCMATVLQANPDLTWRDVQHITVRGSRIPSADTSWTINGAGRHVSHRFGFGLMDCAKMVELAQNWKNFPDQRTCKVKGGKELKIPIGGHVTDTVDTDACASDTGGSIDRLEHVQVKVNVTSQRRGNIRVMLTSPAGTRSEMLSTRKNDDFQGRWGFTFMTVHSWDESPRGTWTLTVSDVIAGNEEKELDDVFADDDATPSDDDATRSDDDDTPGVLHSWSLLFYGTHGTRHSRDGDVADRQQKSYQPSAEAVLRIKREEMKLSKRVQVKKALDVNEKKAAASPKETKITESTTDPETTDRIYQRLYDLLHSFGAKPVRKRVLATTNKKRVLNLKDRMQTDLHKAWDSNMEKKRAFDLEMDELLKRYIERVEQIEETAEQKRVEEDDKEDNPKVVDLKRLSKSQKSLASHSKLRGEPPNPIPGPKYISEKKKEENEIDELHGKTSTVQKNVLISVSDPSMPKKYNSLLKKVIDELEVDIQSELEERKRVNELKRLEKQRNLVQRIQISKKKQIEKQKRIAQERRIAEQKRISEKERIVAEEHRELANKKRLEAENNMIENALIRELIDEIEIQIRDEHI